jgi:diacylglycerol kinase (ATP)
MGRMNAGGHAALTLLQAAAACARAPLDSLRDGDRLRGNDIAAGSILSSKASMERLLRATINTWHGLLAAARSEEAFRQELIALLVAVPLAFLLAEEAWKRLALIGVVVFVLVVELLNTAIEKLADRVNLAIDPQIGRVKDMGSAAVGLALLMAAATWLLAFAERLGLI